MRVHDVGVVFPPAQVTSSTCPRLLSQPTGPILRFKCAGLEPAEGQYLPAQPARLKCMKGGRRHAVGGSGKCDVIVRGCAMFHEQI